MFRSATNFSVFKDSFSDEDKIEWDLNSTITTYASGQVLFYEGTRPFGVFVLLKGKVKLYKTGESGKNQIFQICTDNDIFGFHPVLSDQVYPDSASTLEECEILFVSKQTFLSLVKNSPTLSFNFLTQLSLEFGKLIEQETIMAQQPVRERIALVLYFLSKIYDSVEILFSRQDLSDMSGTVKETFVRILREFKDSGILSSSGRKITILNMNKLKKIANYTL